MFKKLKDNVKMLYIVLYPRKPLLLPTAGTYFKQSRFYLQGLMWVRFLYFTIRNKGKVEQYSDKTSSALSYAIFHNWKEDFGLMRFNRGRLEQLIYPLMCISEVRRNASNKKVLCVGPKNEGELLLWPAHGFKWGNITGIDLFSYTPKIKVADVQNMPFNNDSFDIVAAGWVLRYCEDPKKAIQEIIRVTKNGGYVAIGYSWLSEARSKPISGQLNGGMEELLGFFEDNIGEIYWKVSDKKSEEETTYSLVLSIKKST